MICIFNTQLNQPIDFVLLHVNEEITKTQNLKQIFFYGFEYFYTSVIITLNCSAALHCLHGATLTPYFRICRQS